MPNFEQGDVVRVPFPYTDRSTRQMRPALVVSDGLLGDGKRLLWVVMITSAENRPWLDDVAIADASECGLPAPSIIRPCEIATVEAAYTERIGQVPRTVMDEVKASLCTRLGIEAA